jgi:hypothetical protein
VEATLRNAAKATAPIVAKYGIPLKLLTRAQVDAGGTGFTYHMWLDPTRRSDPGRDFPYARFFELVRAELDGTQEDDMPSAEEVAKAVWALEIRNGQDGSVKSAGERLARTHEYAGAARDVAQATLAAVEGVPEKVADAVWWRSSGLLDANGVEIPLWKVLRALADDETNLSAQIAELAARYPDEEQPS